MKWSTNFKMLSLRQIATGLKNVNYWDLEKRNVLECLFYFKKIYIKEKETDGFEILSLYFLELF